MPKLLFPTWSTTLYHFFGFLVFLYGHLWSQFRLKIAMWQTPSLQITTGKFKLEGSAGVQPPAWTRLSHEVSTDCPGLHPLRSWKALKMGTAQMCLCHCLTDLMEKSFSLCAICSSLVSFHAYCTLFSHYALLWRAWPPLLDNLPIDNRELLLGAPPKLSPLQAKQDPIPKPSLTEQVLQSLTISTAFCWTHSRLSMSFFGWVTQNWM